MFIAKWLTICPPEENSPLCSGNGYIPVGKNTGGCMPRKKQQHKALFCTECGNELNDFWQSTLADDYKGVLMHRVECLDKGRPTHRVCAKLFIVGDGITPEQPPRQQRSPRNLRSLKDSILRRIAAEDNSPASSPKPRRKK
jgi:hypothetical protein